MHNSSKSTISLNETINPSTNGSTVPLAQEKVGFGIRNVQAILLFLCFVSGYILRINLSFAIVAMTNRNHSNTEFEEFAWDESTKGKILSSFYWGYLIIQVPAGLMGQTISPKTLLIITNTLCSLLTLIIPIAAHYGGWMMLCAIRVLQGLCQGFYVPMTYTLASKWCPVNEQNRFIGFTLNGGTLGATVVMPLSGYLASSAGGWPSIFYVTGGIGLLWVLLWVFQGSDSPATDSKISQTEREYIQNSLQHNSEETLPVPWAAILTSPPMLAFIAAHIGCGWTFSIIFTQIPSYINSVLGFNIATNGLLSAIPYLTMWCISYPVFWLADVVNERQVCSTTNLRKMWATISGTAAAITLICIAFVGRDATSAMILMVIAVSLSSCAFSGVYVNPLDLAPNFAGVLTGIGNGLENISSILAPLSVGWIISDNTSVEQWTMVFLLAVIVDVSGNIIFLIWGSAELQPWNEPVNKQKSNVEMSSEASPPPYAVTAQIF